MINIKIKKEGSRVLLGGQCSVCAEWQVQPLPLDRVPAIARGLFMRLLAMAFDGGEPEIGGPVGLGILICSECEMKIDRIQVDTRTVVIDAESDDIPDSVGEPLKTVVDQP